MLELYAALFAGHVGLGVVAVLAWYWFYEYSWNLSVGFAAITAAGSVLLWSVVGELVFDFTLPEFKAAIIATVMGAVIGVSLGVLLFKPDVDSGAGRFGDESAARGKGGAPGYEDWLSENSPEKRRSEAEVDN